MLPKTNEHERPMSAYKLDQTGAKILSGGDHVGFFSPAYQGSKLRTTKIAGKAPAATLPMIQDGEGGEANIVSSPGPLERRTSPPPSPPLSPIETGTARGMIGPAWNVKQRG